MKKVIYIVSSGHSGSTILDLMLSCHSKIHGGGELSALPIYLALGKRCTCLESVEKCRFWSEVAQRGGLVGIRGQDRDAKQRTIIDNRSLFNAILETSGAEYVVDSSKSVRRLDRIRLEGIPTKVIHLIRDPRAVGFSHLRKRRSFANYLLSWKRKQFRISTYLPRIESAEVLKVRYEDLVCEPNYTIGRIHRWLDLETESLPNELDFSENHNIDGNRARFNKTTRIRVDDEYVNELDRIRWTFATVVSMQSLRANGYPITRKACGRLLSRSDTSKVGRRGTDR